MDIEETVAALLTLFHQKASTHENVEHLIEDTTRKILVTCYSGLAPAVDQLTTYLPPLELADDTFIIRSK
jgi:dihydrodipicolinate synthase/N-acetylneuraminate lyase